MLYNSDKLGYYSVGAFKTYMKLEAIVQDRKTNFGIKWHFNDQEFNHYDWTRCPSFSLDYLYQQRAEQLRNSYDKIVIFYSGGSDSQTVLDTFVKHRVPIDHVVCCHAMSGNGYDQSAYFNEEIFKVAVPHLKSISHQLVFTQIHLIDQTESILTGFDDFDWWTYQNNAFTPNCVTRSKIRDWYQPFADLVSSGQRVAFVWGRDKPKIFKSLDGKIYTQFNDHNDNNTSPYSQLRHHDGWFDEFFFQDPNCADIVCRQVHEVVNRLDEQSIHPKFFQEHTTENGQCPYSQQYLTNNGISSIIYPNWSLSTFSNGKNPSMIWGKRDQWFFDHYQDSTAYKNWIASIRYLQTFLTSDNSQHHWVSEGFRFNNVKGCPSEKYYIT